MNTLDRLAIEKACEQLQYSYARFIDFRDYEGFVELFCTDGLLSFGDQELRGRDAIFAYCQKRPAGLRSRHVITNPFIDVLDENTARGICYFTVYRRLSDPTAARVALPMPAPAAMGHYEDRYCRIDGRWYFQHRTAQVAFRDQTQS